MSATRTIEEVSIPKANGRSHTKTTSDSNGHAAPKSAQRLVKAATASELGAQLVKGNMADLNEGQREGYDLWLENYQAKMVAAAESYVGQLVKDQQPQAAQVGELIGEITEPRSAICPTGYNAFDVLSFSPLEIFSGPLMPASNPDKILRATNFGTPNLTIAAHLAVVFINPVPSTPCGFTVPPTIQLGGRTLRVGFDVMNVTNVSAGLSAAFNLTLPSPAPALIFVPFFFVVPNVANAEIFELNVTADIIESPQPYSAFATFHNDRDDEISLFGNVGPERQHDAPNRYMIYPF